jgi:predicted alpha/beta superfamily hydrolase
MTEDGSPVVILDSRAHTVSSSVVNDDYQLAVWLPPSYASSTAQYPVVYVLDAPMTFGLAAQGTMISIFGDVLPEVIVVGVGFPLQSAYEGWPRSRDYAPVPIPDEEGSGHAAAFVECLRTELLPFIDQTYRTNVADRTLWGHSIGGALALHLLLENRGLFQRLIATSPGVVVQGQAMLDHTSWPPPGSQLSARLFVSVGSVDDEFRPHIEAFNADLRERDYQGLQFESAVLPGYGHIGAAPIRFLAGLRAVFTP